MYSYADRLRAVELYIRLGYATSHDVHVTFDLIVSLGTVLVPTPIPQDGLHRGYCQVV